MLSPFVSRFAAHWVTDALAGDESLDFSVIKALLGVSTDSLEGAPEATRERVALRCLQELVSVAAEGDATAEAAGRMLNVDATRSCEELLLELIGQVGSSGSLEKDMLPPFSQDIQKFIYIKMPALPDTSFELLREVNPEIASMVPSYPVEQNGNKKHANDPSLCNISHDHVNTVNLGCSTDSVERQQENLTNLVNETDTTNVQKNPMEPAPVFDQPCTSYSKCYDHHQENTIGVSVRSPEKSPTNVDRNMSAAAGPAKAGCGAALLGSNTKPMAKQDAADCSTMLQPQSCGDTYPNPPHYNDGERPHDDSTSIWSPKDLIHEGPTLQATVAPDFDRSADTLPTNTYEASHLPEFVTAQDTAMFAEPRSSRIHPSSPQHGSSEKLNQDLHDGSARIQPVENVPDHDELGTAGVVPSVNCDEAIQGNKSETNQPNENATEHTEMFEQQNESLCCNGVLHNKSPEDNSLAEKNTGTNMADIQKPCCTRSVPNSPRGTDIQKPCCTRSVPNSPRDGNEGAKQAANKKIVGNTVAETSCMHCSDDSSSSFAAACLLSMAGNMPCSPDKDANGSLEGLSEQDLCVKCGKGGQLLKCISCLLAAHDICFGSSVRFDDSGQFYCPVCYYTKATQAYQKAKKTYSEARKNLSAFLGTNQHEKSTGKQPRAANSEDHLNGCNTSKRRGNHQSEADNLSNKDENPGQQRKKQKKNSISDTCPEEVVTEKASFGLNSNVAPMNKDCVLQNKRKQVHVTAQHSSQNRCSPAANQNVVADKDNGPAYSRECGNSDEIEATSSNDSGKRSSPPWRNMRHHKERFQKKERVVLNNSKKALGCQDQGMPSPQRKRSYAHPPKRYSNPLAPLGRRRSKLCWAEVEEEALREAMTKFTPKDDGPIPWVQILEYGRDVFDKTRLPEDLRVKWRYMTKKSSSSR